VTLCGQLPDISYVLPCLNEAKYVQAALDSLLSQDISDRQLEILVVDGGSQDDTRAIIELSASQTTSSHAVYLHENPRRSAASGYNVGIAGAQAPIIVLGGARTIYPPHHAQTVLDLMASSTVFVVGGGVRRFLPDGDSPLARAISAIYLSPMGAGAAAYHRRRSAGVVDTVYCAAYRREVLREISGVDERFVRGQDAELNSRIQAAGYRILFDPRLSTDYQFRGGLRHMIIRAYRTGRYNALGWRMNPATIRLRHLVPLAWMMFLLSAPWQPVPFLVYAVCSCYLVLLLVATITLASVLGIVAALHVPLVFALFHVAYGIGQIRGLVSPHRESIVLTDGHRQPW
jgi:glycosyltransferase involved in cell wall biosynthesis